MTLFVLLTIHVASKTFTENVILAEMATQLLRDAGIEADHRRALGGTEIVWHALESREIDLYPEYTGTLRAENLRVSDDAAVARELAARGITMSRPLGFNDTYAIGMKEDVASRLGIQTISDLLRHPELRLGFSNEFMARPDGWPGLRARYSLPQKNVRGLDHDVAYRALDGGTIDATDLYSTDAEIRYYHLRTLVDDRHAFPSYDAVLLWRGDLPAAAVAVLRRLEGAIDEPTMISLNARAKLDRVPESVVAADFLRAKFGSHVDGAVETPLLRLWRTTREHLFLVAVSLLLAIAIAVPLGIVGARRPAVGQVALAVTGLLQTIPSLALLVFMIPLLGIGAPPAIVALFLYSLLPIVRSTYTGLRDIPPDIRESAEALGLSPGARLRLVELPMASRQILAGIKTSAVINVGTATLGALIGAGGYGQPILTGIRLDDLKMILSGAVPAAVLTLLVQGAFEILERLLVPKGLRL